MRADTFLLEHHRPTQNLANVKKSRKETLEYFSLKNLCPFFVTVLTWGSAIELFCMKSPLSSSDLRKFHTVLGEVRYFVQSLDSVPRYHFVLTCQSQDFLEGQTCFYNPAAKRAFQKGSGQILSVPESVQVRNQFWGNAGVFLQLSSGNCSCSMLITHPQLNWTSSGTFWHLWVEMLISGYPAQSLRKDLLTKRPGCFVSVICRPSKTCWSFQDTPNLVTNFSKCGLSLRLSVNIKTLRGKSPLCKNTQAKKRWEAFRPKTR